MKTLDKEEAFDIIRDTSEKYRVIDIGPWESMGCYSETRAIIFKDGDSYYRLRECRSIDDLTTWFKSEIVEGITCKEVEPVLLTRAIWKEI